MNLSNVICPVQARISLLEIFDEFKCRNLSSSIENFVAGNI